MRRITVVLASVLLAAVTAVGVTAVDAPDADAAARGGYVKKCGGGKIFLNAKEKQSFHLHNKARKSRGIKTLCVHPKLQKIARAHSKDMIQRNYFSHNTKGSGASPAVRARKVGYPYRYLGENIAYGSGSYGTPKSIFNRWMKSKSHRPNILARKYREVGIGTYTGTWRGHQGVTMYTADFGTRR